MPEADNAAADIDLSGPPPAIDASTPPASARNVAVNLAELDAGQQAAANAGDDDAALDAVLASIKGGEGREAATAVYAAGGKPASTPTAAAPAKPVASPTAGAAPTGTTPADATAQPVQLAPEHRDLLSRFKVRESSFNKLEPDERAELLSNLAERHHAQAKLYNDNVAMAARLRGEQPAAAAPNGKAPAAAAPPANPADPYGQIDALFAPFLDAGQSLSAPIKAALAPLLEQAEQAKRDAQMASAGLTGFWQHKATEDQQAGLAAVKVEGVSLDQRTVEGKANQQKLLEVAGRLLGAAQLQEGWTPYTYGWKDAISEAFPTVFKAQTILAQRKSASQVARQAALRGGDPGGQPNKSQPKESEDAYLDRILSAQRQGATREELVAIGSGRG